MPSTKADIISRLKREILPLEGLRSSLPGMLPDLGLGPMNEAFPQGAFPLGAVHEMICDAEEQVSATAGFIAGLLSGLMKGNGAALWIGSSRILFPPALKMFGIDPDKILFADLQKEVDVLWTMEEALKCTGLSAVISEMSELSFTASRRFQLAVEQSRVTGFIIRNQPRHLLPNACVSRWRIQAIPSLSEDDLPGLGFPCWNVELQKIRNGKPGSWQMEWAAGRFRYLTENISSLLLEPSRKTG
jgi:protein ImuA